MEENLIELAKSHLTPDVILRASALLGESPSSTRSALETASSAIFAGVAGEASSTSGAQKLIHVIEEAGLRGPASSVTDRLGAKSGEELIAGGEALIDRLFGGRLAPIVNAIASTSGVKTSSMRSLLGLAAPLVLGAIGSQVHARGLDAAGLGALLSEQKGAAAAALPSRIASALGLAPATRAEQHEAEPERAPRKSSRLWPLLLVIPAVLLGAFLLRKGRQPAAPEVSAPEVSAPDRRAPEPATPRGFGAGLPPETSPDVEAPPGDAAHAIEVPLSSGGVQRFGEGTLVWELDQFLSGPGEESSRFLLDGVQFDSGSARLTPASLPVIDGIAAVLKAHPSAHVLLEGHTDRTGPENIAQPLSLQRANAVQSALVARGVDADRVATAGAGSTRPIAPNDTAEGRAQNRRTELVVTRR